MSVMSAPDETHNSEDLETIITFIIKKKETESYT